MKSIIAISDLHGNLPRIEACDLLLIAGDICPLRDHGLERQAIWLATEFKKWLEEVPADEIIVVPGNHDFIFEENPRLCRAIGLPCHILIDEGVDLDGVKIWGTPWQPWFYSWAFNAPQDDLKEEFLHKKFDQIPDDTDIIVCHGPPYGFGDKATRDERVGSKALLAAIRRVKPEYMICGHIHEAYGLYRVGDTDVVNCSFVDARYQPVNNPVYLAFDQSPVSSVD